MEERVFDMKCEHCGEETPVIYNVIDIDGKHRRLCWICVQKEVIQTDKLKGIKSMQTKGGK